MKQGTLFVFSGPSGTGKDTVLQGLAAQNEKFMLSISATTRAPRGTEKHGEEYYFLTVEEFEKLIAEDGLLEYAQYCGNYYGTPKAPIQKALDEGIDVFLEIEVQGAMLVKERFPDSVSIFMLPPSMSVLSHRLHKRQTDSEEVIQKRLNAAREEISHSPDYDYIIVNDVLEEAVEELKHIVHAERVRAYKMKETVTKALQSEDGSFAD